MPRMKLSRIAGMVAVALGASVSVASAHVAVASGPATSGVSNIVTFQIGHGCDKVNGANDAVSHDTLSLKITIPTDAAGNSLVSSVRAIPNGQFTNPIAIETNDAGGVKSVTFSKPESALTATDTQFYTVQLRFALKGGSPVTNTPAFSTLSFNAEQVCEDPATKAKKTVLWDGVDHGGGAEPAASLIVVGARRPGWNQYTIATHIPDPSVFFSDAQIVWRDTAAYSANPLIAKAIAATAGVTTITAGIHPDDVIWVKY